MGNHSLIHGGLHEDNRGKLLFFNKVDMSQIKRMYQIEPANEEVIRAWQGHKVERKWFYCLQGGFIINLVKIPNFEFPDVHLNVVHNRITDSSPDILLVEGGYASGIKATAPNSKLLVFSNLSTEASKNDDYRFDVGFWKAKWD